MADYTQGLVYTRTFFMVQSADHITGATGVTVTLTASKAGGAFAAVVGPVSEIGNGWYKVVLAAADTDTAGDLAFHATGAACDPTDWVDQVVTLGTSSSSITFSLSAVNICNQALLLNGGRPITSLSQTESDEARMCAQLYPLVRDYCIASATWNCCIKRVQLNPDVAAPLDDWTYQYTLPADYVRALQVSSLYAEDDYRIEGGKLLTDATPLRLRYVFLNTDETSWHSLLVYAVVQSMRAALSFPQSSDKGLLQLIEGIVRPVIIQAQGADAVDQPPEQFGDSPLRASRWGRGYRTAY